MAIASEALGAGPNTAKSCVLHFCQSPDDFLRPKLAFKRSE